MKNWILVLFSSAAFLITFASCDSPKPQQGGETYLETAAKNSAQAKEAEQKVNDAAAKVNADIDAAMKQAQGN